MEGTVLISVNDKDKAEAVTVAKSLSEDGFRIIATGGTYAALTAAGIPAERVNKLQEGRPNINDMILNGDISLVVNSPAGKSCMEDDSYLRKAAIKAKGPYITTMAAAIAAAEGIRYIKNNNASDIQSMQSLHSQIR